MSCFQVVKLWRKDLAKINPKAAESLASPDEYLNLFPNLQVRMCCYSRCNFGVCMCAHSTRILIIEVHWPRS